MDRNISDIKFYLRRLAKQIEKVEDKDANYRNNPKWLELRSKQDRLYIELAKKEKENVY